MVAKLGSTSGSERQVALPVAVRVPGLASPAALFGPEGYREIARSSSTKSDDATGPTRRLCACGFPALLRTFTTRVFIEVSP